MTHQEKSKMCETKSYCACGRSTPGVPCRGSAPDTCHFLEDWAVYSKANVPRTLPLAPFQKPPHPMTREFPPDSPKGTTSTRPAPEPIQGTGPTRDTHPPSWSWLQRAAPSPKEPTDTPKKKKTGHAKPTLVGTGEPFAHVGRLHMTPSPKRQ